MALVVAVALMFVVIGAIATASAVRSKQHDPHSSHDEASNGGTP